MTPMVRPHRDDAKPMKTLGSATAASTAARAANGGVLRSCSISSRISRYIYELTAALPPEQLSFSSLTRPSILPSRFFYCWKNVCLCLCTLTITICVPISLDIYSLYCMYVSYLYRFKCTHCMCTVIGEDKS